jgi:hypothetical protein
MIPAFSGTEDAEAYGKLNCGNVTILGEIRNELTMLDRAGEILFILIRIDKKPCRAEQFNKFQIMFTRAQLLRECLRAADIPPICAPGA